MLLTKLCCIKGFFSCPLLFLKSFKCVLPSLSHGQRTVTNTLAAQCKSKPQKKVCKTVLKHFDAQYSEELGEQWHSARDVLLNPLSWQYGVLLNRFSDLTNLKQWLAELGYTNLLPQTHPKSQTAHIPLQCFIHQDPVRIPTQSHHPGWLKQYFLLNAASLLPVLSLNLKEGENVLDLCAAPGAKSLAILQTFTPGLLHCNEVDRHRHDWLLKTLESYVPPAQRHLLSVTHLDGRSIGSVQPGAYDKVLVDAPCSNDRSWLYTPDTNQGEMWLKERTQLPLLQKELLCVSSSPELCYPVQFGTVVGTIVFLQQISIVLDVWYGVKNDNLASFWELCLIAHDMLTHQVNSKLSVISAEDLMRRQISGTKEQKIGSYKRTRLVIWDVGRL
ncbi:putative methyltransferase NSUN3 [Sinocyclocheilus anshuiensis]|uniref:putative methyltransferase NSUN3 n=1 Tax=Sinocyclocheilus anshuiensis TaxID=1608454 RepID=UPI0007B88799|nr:PREDICTED: putative methyltransferase NSUN3 [Sinocyclocheilus anshuiensis]